MNKLLINTPQNVNFEYQLASVGARCIAWALDLGIIILYSIFIVILLGNLGLFDQGDIWLTMGVYSLATLPSIFYPLIMETFLEGQSIGKRIMKIKVVKIDGTRATFYQYFIRWVSNAVDVLLSMGGLGLTAIILSQKSQRIGDMAADTAVISVKNNMQLKDTLFEEITAEYQVVHPEVMQLSDQDINEIKNIYNTGYRRKNYQIIQALAAKVEVLLGIKSQVLPEKFVAQVIQDHYYMFKEQ